MPNTTPAATPCSVLCWCALIGIVENTVRTRRSRVESMVECTVIESSHSRATLLLELSSVTAELKLQKL